MLAKKFRLPSSVIFQNAHFIKEKEFSVKFQKNLFPYSRFGFVVSKSVDKKATTRNRLKRVFRSVIEKEWLNKIKGLDILFVLRPAIKDLRREKFLEEIGLVMERIVI